MHKLEKNKDSFNVVTAFYAEAKTTIIPIQ